VFWASHGNVFKDSGRLECDAHSPREQSPTFRSSVLPILLRANWVKLRELRSSIFARDSGNHLSSDTGSYTRRAE
jgi:hypothetical protein